MMSDNMDKPPEREQGEPTRCPCDPSKLAFRMTDVEVMMKQGVPLEDAEGWEDDGGNIDLGRGDIHCGDEEPTNSEDEDEYEPSVAERVAAAGSALAVTDITDEERMSAIEQIVSGAPEHLKDDFQICCALFLYRQLLVEAVQIHDTGMIYEAQSAVLSLIEPE